MPSRVKPSPALARPASPANLRPWRKGQSGNPKGRPPLPDIREALAEVLAEPVAGTPSLYAVLRALRDRAIAGDVRAAEVLLDRCYGKPTQRTDVTTDGAPLRLTPPIVWSDSVGA